MKHLIFSIFDQKAKAYLPPFTLPSSPMATRVFSDCVNSTDHNFGRHPGDYSLLQIGEWDDNTAEIIPATPPQMISNGLELLNPTKPEIKHGQLDEVSNDPPVLTGAQRRNTA